MPSLPPLKKHNSTFKIKQLTLHNATKYKSQYISLLGQLTEAPDIENDKFMLLLQKMLSQCAIFLVLNQRDSSVVAAATLLLEQKIVHGGSKVGHIEDVVVNDKYRGYGLGKYVVKACTQYAKEQHCYKVILDCTEKNAPFYEKCGFRKKELQMRMDLPKLSSKL